MSGQLQMLMPTKEAIEFSRMIMPVREPRVSCKAKTDYLRDISRDTSIEKWEFADLKLTLTGDRATLTGKVTLFRRDGKRVLDFVDKFVWRDGRWQATGSAVNQNEGSDLVF